jgi:cell division protein FtsI (penicillin-binding protein 3)
MSATDRRVGLVFGAFVVLLLLILVRAIWLQGVEGSSLAGEAQSQQVQTIVVPGSRGTIYDRRGNELAVSEDAATVYATPYQVKDPAKTADKLAGVLDLPADKILESLADRSSGFAYIARKVGIDVADKVQALHLSGIGTLPDSRRVYPQGAVGGQVIGTVGTDNQGLTGIEESEDGVLYGNDGEREVVQDALGQELERNTVTPATTGGDLRLSIDSSVQAETEKVLAEIGRAYQPDGATAVVMDPRNSEVLAMANWPGVDPRDPANADPDALGNMATGFTYEPGSTFKAFTVAGALQEHLVTPETRFDLAPTIQVADRTIEESHERGYVDYSVADILKYSSNVGAVTIGLKLGAKDFDKWIHAFGFGQPTGVRFPGEEQGIVIPIDQYSGSTMGNLPIGQGLSVTPIQMAAAYSAIADGGELCAPRLILDENGSPVSNPPCRRVISAEHAAEIRKMLEGVLESGGTAANVNVPGYTLGGKTGTAQKVDPETGTYSDTEYVASFVGFAPATKPGLLAAIVVDNPKGDIYGGTVAAPAFGEIAKFALPYLGIPPS